MLVSITFRTQVDKKTLVAVLFRDLSITFDSIDLLFVRKKNEILTL